MPFLLEELVECHTGFVHGGAGRVEQEAVFDHELEVSVELFSIGVDTAAELILHSRHVHRLLDDFGIMRDVKGDNIWNGNETAVAMNMEVRRTDWSIKRIGNRIMLLLVQILKDGLAELELLGVRFASVLSALGRLQDRSSISWRRDLALGAVERVRVLALWSTTCA